MQVLNQAQTSLISGGFTPAAGSLFKKFNAPEPTPMPAPITPVAAPIACPDCE
jgi:hypothetical protein